MKADTLWQIDTATQPHDQDPKHGGQWVPTSYEMVSLTLQESAERG